METSPEHSEHSWSWLCRLHSHWRQPLMMETALGVWISLSPTPSAGIGFSPHDEPLFLLKYDFYLHGVLKIATPKQNKMCLFTNIRTPWKLIACRAHFPSHLPPSAHHSSSPSPVTLCGPPDASHTSTRHCRGQWWSVSHAMCCLSFLLSNTQYLKYVSI